MSNDLAAFIAARADEKERFATTARLAAKHREHMLREVAAMRAILAEHQREDITDKWVACHRCVDWSAGTFYGDKEENEWPPDDMGRMSWPCATLRALAAVWDDHPDYREEWKP